jgi:DNA-directed RNA polymerase subunit beta
MGWKGDILADNSSSHQGELAIGQNILVGYTPWEGYNLKTQCYLVND